MRDQQHANRAGFSHIGDGTAQDLEIIVEAAQRFSHALPDRVLDHLRLLQCDDSGFPVDRLTHCLQTATLAYRDSKDEEYVVCALLHDVGDTLGPYNHADIAASMLEPFVSTENHWMVKHHAIFQGYFYFHHLGMDRNLREQYRDHPCYEQTIEFVAKYDSPAFDVDGETLPLQFFEPMLRRIMARPVRSLYMRNSA